MAISKQLVEMMGGEIGVKSEPGVGSTFWFTVCLEKRPESEEADPAANVTLHGLRVLVTDDNLNNRKILHKQLTSWGMEDGMAEDATKALERLRAAAENGEPYELAILDMQMPDMDGVELARTIKDDPTIASTRLMLLSSTGVDIGEERRRAGVETVLTKPVRQSQLYDALATMVGAGAERFAGWTREDVAPASRATAVVETPPFRGHVLLAEDNLVNQRVAMKMLERLGYRVDVAQDGNEAVEAALSHVPYAAVLMDVQMPEMDGYEATKEIRRHEGSERHTPIIAMTANALEGDREKALAAGMDDYISKPVKPEELEAVLVRWVRRDGAPDATGGASGDGPVSQYTTEDEIEAPLDPEVLAGLRELGGAEMVAELAEMFYKDASSHLASLREAIEGDDSQLVHRSAHTLKGSSGNMGAKRMAALCAELESVSASGDLARAPELLERLEEEFGRVRPTLEALLARSQD